MGTSNSKTDLNKQFRLSFNSSPSDIKISVLIRLPFQEFVNIFRTSKSWYQLYNDKDFWLSKVVYDIHLYYSRNPNFWDLKYSQDIIKERFDDILTFLSTYKSIDKKSSYNKRKYSSSSVSCSSSSLSSCSSSSLNIRDERKLIKDYEKFNDISIKNKFLLGYLIITNLYDINDYLLIGTYKSLWNMRHGNYDKIKAGFLALSLADEGIFVKSDDNVMSNACMLLSYAKNPKGLTWDNIPKSRYRTYKELLSNNKWEDKIKNLFSRDSLFSKYMNKYLMYKFYDNYWNKYSTLTILHNIEHNDNKPITSNSTGSRFMGKLILYYYASRNENISIGYLSVFEGFRNLAEFISTIAPSFKWIEENSKIKENIDCSGPVMEYLMKKEPPSSNWYNDSGNLTYEYLHWKYEVKESNIFDILLRPDNWEAPMEN